MCGSCGYELYLNPRPSGGVVVVDGDRFLALRRAREPKAGQWELPSGFCDGWEHPVDAAVREAREELGVDVELGPFLGMYLDRYDYQDEALPVLDCFWLARLAGGPVTVDPREASEFAWLPLGEPPPLAFSSMDRAVRAASISGSPGV
ncbi:NUDIX hydrolase [Planosporangium sp. 12N6]|uniref:NUDIX hydrolase n=1 Tax=Planosporangium spinosum TaxID=3402278 RepID=UPI003CF757F4